MEYVLIPWTNITDRHGFSRWSVPGAIETLDLRSRTQQARKDGVAEGFAFAVFESLVVSQEVILLGDSLGTFVDINKKSVLVTELGLGESIVADNVTDILWELQTLHADVKGIDRWKNAMPQRNGILSLSLGSLGILKQERIVPFLSDSWPDILKNLHEQYKNYREGALAGRFPANFHRQMLTVWQEKYGVKDYTVFIPPGFPNETPEPHDSLISDNFNRGNESLDASADWVELDGDWAVETNEAAANASGADNKAQHQTVLTTDDMYVQANMSKSATNGKRSGVSGRFQDADNWYTAFQQTDAGDDILEIVKEVAGGAWTVVGGTTTEEWSNGAKLRIEINGNQLRLLVDDVEKLANRTDNDLSGINDAGMIAQFNAQSEFDNFEAADISGVDIRKHIIPAYMRMN